MQTYNEIYHLYGEISEAACIEPGYEFFQELSNPKRHKMYFGKREIEYYKNLTRKETYKWEAIAGS